MTSSIRTALLAICVCALSFLAAVVHETEFAQDTVHCSDYGIDPLQVNVPRLSPEAMRARMYFHQQQMRRQIVTMDKVGRIFFQRNWEPSFSCTATVRFGCPGEGGKWVCDPHRTLREPRCVVYSVGTSDEFGFEEAVHNFNPKCEIHAFDPAGRSTPPYVTFHPWKIDANATTIASVMRALGHANVTILKVDCKGCEYEVLSSPGFPQDAVQQILAEVHFDGAPQRVHRLFNFLDGRGYAIFSKEPDMQYERGNAVEFSMVHMATNI